MNIEARMYCQSSTTITSNGVTFMKLMIFCGSAQTMMLFPSPFALISFHPVERKGSGLRTGWIRSVFFGSRLRSEQVLPVPLSPSTRVA